MGRGNRPEDANDEGAAARPTHGGPFTEPSLPPASAPMTPKEVLRLVVVLQERDGRDFLAVVTREPGGIRVAGCRATDPFAAVQGACSAAVETLRAGSKR